ncbi:MAG: hypothetical protein JXR94_13700 [Candidatus Hydrogenedentes bacterium]|nr:hypothetical protein [Candidatus Hydrogenedentota bacterium]
MQLELCWRDEAALRTELERRSGLRLHLVVTDNASTVLSVKHEPAGGGARLRLHHMFLAASPEVLGALASWLKRPKCRRSGAVLDRFIHEHGHLVRTRPGRGAQARTRGHWFDLRRLYEEVNEAHFEGRVQARITWGRRPAARRRRSIRFGSYSASDNLIRIHPLLDQEFVPEYFVRYIVFHEMLHAHLGIGEWENGRRSCHDAEFRRRERAYPEYAQAAAWARSPSHLRKLLR